MAEKHRAVMILLMFSLGKENFGLFLMGVFGCREKKIECIEFSLLDEGKKCSLLSPYLKFSYIFCLLFMMNRQMHGLGFLF